MYCDVHTGLAGLRVDLSLDASGNHLLNLPSPHEHNPVSHSARQSTKDLGTMKGGGSHITHTNNRD